MCYVLLLSTTSNADLTEFNSDALRFTTELPQIADVAQLEFPHRWYVGSRSGCSCGFRHLYSIELGFGEPVDWFEESSEDIEATLDLIRVIRALHERGESVDCVDAWDHREMHPVAETTLEVDLDTVSDTQFRLFENHRFVFRRRT
jgi:hypothetical protein